MNYSLQSPQLNQKPLNMLCTSLQTAAVLPCSFKSCYILRNRQAQIQRTTMMKVIAMAKGGSEETEAEGNGVIEKVAIGAGLVSTPVIAWSLYTLKTTGCGLPPGAGGSIGALEGVSYLAVVGIVGWSLYIKAKTGSGLPNGPFGLLGAVEGFSYLSLLAILLVFGLQFVEKGSLPGPLPGEECFG